jgi:hypothetical protein
MKQGVVMARRVPYGVSNYAELVRDNSYFVDKTPYIAQLVYWSTTWWNEKMLLFAGLTLDAGAKYQFFSPPSSCLIQYCPIRESEEPGLSASAAFWQIIALHHALVLL